MKRIVFIISFFVVSININAMEAEDASRSLGRGVNVGSARFDNAQFPQAQFTSQTDNTYLLNQENEANKPYLNRILESGKKGPLSGIEQLGAAGLIQGSVLLLNWTFPDPEVEYKKSENFTKYLTGLQNNNAQLLDLGVRLAGIDSDDDRKEILLSKCQEMELSDFSSENYKALSRKKLFKHLDWTNQILAINGASIGRYLQSYQNCKDPVLKIQFKRKLDLQIDIFLEEKEKMSNDLCIVENDLEFREPVIFMGGAAVGGAITITVGALFFLGILPPVA